ncbi:LytTR family transcriptional regulator [Terrimonas sp. NA20]|uniref:LytTR family transcriptional regulator n=1 Tax=Terrimonas ginsenosidimutans TaxID=2908004 RepID=A0ABS9KN44_9BACT|nr:LytTR family DNA-binding domain-containing protein [Terrimonas ginsenosidimutans]MCG2613742.1 LytTR family transcriptional regulator [Terrimonas ginsenosidimutans]
MVSTPFFVWQNKKLLCIDAENVMFLDTRGNYTRIVYYDKTCDEVQVSLVTALKKFPPGMFIQIHRSYAVSIHYIKKISNDTVEVEGEELPIGNKYYQDLINKLTIID